MNNMLIFFSFLFNNTYTIDIKSIICYIAEGDEKVNNPTVNLNKD